MRPIEIFGHVVPEWAETLLLMSVFAVAYGSAAYLWQLACSRWERKEQLRYWRERGYFAARTGTDSEVREALHALVEWFERKLGIR